MSNKKEKAHLQKVAAMPCVACLQAGRVTSDNHGAVELHHIRSTAGAGQRSSDFEVIPLCPNCHRLGGHGVAIHAGQRTWENLYGTEAELLEQVLSLLE